MHDNSLLVQARINRFILERLEPAVYGRLLPLQVTVWHCPGEPVPFDHALAAPYAPIAPGTRWGRPWGTSWFKAAGMVPDTGDGADGVPNDGADGADGHRLELIVDLGNSPGPTGLQVEGMVYTADGRVLRGVEPTHNAVPLLNPVLGPLRAGTALELYVEAAANPNILDNFTFAPTPLGDPGTAGTAPLYTYQGIWLAVRRPQVWELLQDFRTLYPLQLELDPREPRRARILQALEQALNLLEPDDLPGTADAGRQALAGVLASPAHASAHRIHAVGHAHIDSAWLWPVRETVRKVARTFSNVVALMEQNPGFVFAASSAQQYAWLKEYYPELFERVRLKVAAGQFVPAGGMWVEADTNLPGGESLARQFLAGKTFFRREFGVEPLDVWLPDTFGYSAALPQIARAAGSRWFLTQKLSWNDTNVMPHHTFWWEGIDGSRIFTHFPPVATYSAELSPAELHRAQRAYAEKRAANTSLVPFGWGDGGGGPTREMLAAAHRARDLEGSPTVRLSSPAEFFEAAEAEYADPPVWSGELYLEFHRGTYTSQARTKAGNRRSEHLLREAELWATAAAVRTGADYPYEALAACWRQVLLQQFHDILPGSAIGWVHREAERHYEHLAVELGRLIEAALRSLVGAGEHSMLLNAGPYALAGVPALGGAPVPAAEPAPDGEPAPQQQTPQLHAPGQQVPDGGRVSLVPEGGGWVLANGLLRVAVDTDGLISSILDLAADRELIPAGARANLLQLFRDTPNQWDAWDIDTHYRGSVQELRAADAVEVAEDSPARAALRISRSFGGSRVVQLLSLDAGARALEIGTTVHWHERQKLLKLAFPLDILADRAASEIAFGHVYRPTHANTSWDAARFETPAHRWVHVGEPGFGVAVANDRTYGHDISRAGGADGTAPHTLLRLSLLRAPLFPDPLADQGTHTFRISLVSGAGIPEAVRAGYRLNLPLRRLDGVRDQAVAPLLTVDHPGVVVEAVKLAEDGGGDVIVRLYEAHGGRASARLSAGFDFARVEAVDLLERPVAGSYLAPDSGSSGPGESGDGHGVRLDLRPFQLVTLRFVRNDGQGGGRGS